MREPPVCVTIAIAIATIANAGCGKDRSSSASGAGSAVGDSGSATPTATASDAASASATAKTWYRAVLTTDNVEVRFFLGVPPAGSTARATIRVGGQDIETDATFDGKQLSMPMKVHQTSIDATIADDGSMTGVYSTHWKAWGASSLPFRAEPMAPSIAALGTVAESEGAPLDLGAATVVWRLKMNESGNAKLVVQQRAPGELDAVLHLDTGNLIYTAGNARGRKAVMTGFDGTALYRIDLVLAADGKTATGKFFGGHKLGWRETLTATRADGDFVLAVKAKPSKANAKLVLPDLPELASLKDSKAPMLVELAGSWCSTCRYAASFLVELDREYKGRGVQLVTLLYEFSGDPAEDAKQVEHFKSTYGVTWPVVAVPGELDDFADVMPRGVNDLNPAGFPVAVFVDKDRTVVGLHSGFPSPAAPEHRARVEAEFRKYLDRIVTKP